MKVINRTKMTQTLDGIDDNFSPELLAYMGQWLTYCTFQTDLHNYNAGHDDDEQVTFKTLFDVDDIWAEGLGLGYSFHYGPEGDKRFFWMELFLKFHGLIVEGKSPRYCKSNASYEQVWDRFLNAPKSSEHPIFPAFAKMTSHSLPRTDSLSFSIDEDCRPLIEAFCQESFMAVSGDTYVWTQKIRPLMEALGIWSEGKSEREKQTTKQKLIAKLNTEYLRAYEKSLDKKSLHPLIQFIKRHPNNLQWIGPARDSIIPIFALHVLFKESTQAWRDAAAEGNKPENRIMFEGEHPLKPTPTAIRFLCNIDFETIIPSFKPLRHQPSKTETEYKLR